MNTWGIAAGIGSAILQSCSYVASAAYLKRRAKPFEMLMYSQGFQFFFALALLVWLSPWKMLGDSAILRANALWLVIFTIAQFSMFAAQRFVEPSKIATWLGLKIVVLALLAVFWPIGDGSLGPVHWIAIGITVAAAWLLNASGGLKTGWKGGLFLASQIIVASFCDRQQVHIMQLFQTHGSTMFQSALLTLSLGYFSFGIAAIGWSAWNIARSKASRGAFKDAVWALPFALFWFTAMICIYFCYGELGPVFGNVVQSTRAVIAVGIGYLAFKLLPVKVEATASLSMWLRRLAAAILMTLGIILYNIG